MTADRQNTTPANIENPRLWRLALELDGTDALRAVVWNSSSEASLLQFTVPLNPTQPPIKALEEAIYATPVLLSDFLSIDVVIRTQAYTIVPAGISADNAEAIAAYACLTSEDGTVTIEDKTDITGRGDAAQPIHGATVMWCIGAEIYNFLARTFRNPRIQCHITPLIRFFGANTLRGNSAKVYIHIVGTGTNRAIDIVTYDRAGTLVAATTHTVPTDNDAIYYTLATAQLVGIDTDAGDEILLCGDSAARTALMPQLRRYAPAVMPMIFPSAAFRNGREALNAPFPLVILPLCE